MNSFFSFLTVGLILLSGVLNGQEGAVLDPSGRVFLQSLRACSGDAGAMAGLAAEYDLVPIGGEYHLGVLALVDEATIDRVALRQMGVHTGSVLGQLWTMRVPVSRLDEFVRVTGIRYIEVGYPVSPDLVRALPSARVDSVHAGLGDLGRAYTGAGVIVAVVDWGFDYTHPVFYDTTLTQLRISRAWDQNKLSGPPPSGYSFGTEYVGAQQLLAAQCDTNYVFGYSSHGTHVAGIAGGSAAGTDHMGVAFESELIFVSLRRDAPSLIDAFTWIADHAQSVGKPFVVNMSFGSHLGPHDGTDLKNQGIDLLHGPGRVFVGSAGNNGGSASKFHLEKDFNATPGDTLKTVVHFANNTGQFGQTLSMWGSPLSDFSVALRIVDAANNTLFETPFYHSLQEPMVNDTMLVGNDTLIVRIQSAAQSFLNDKPNIRLEVKRTGAVKVVLLATSQNTHLHIWNNVRMNNRYTNWGVTLGSGYPGAVEGNAEYGLGEPAGVGKNVITVASYVAEIIHNNNVLLGNLSSFSSAGPTVDNRTKPDIASVGQNVISSVNSFDITQGNFSTTVTHQGRTYGFASFSGTSMSAPLVTGIVALMLEANPLLSAVQVKEILKATARLDNHTGAIDSTGDLQWGWGKANALAAVKAAELLVKVPDAKVRHEFIRFYPNPANQSLTIEIPDQTDAATTISVYQLTGQRVHHQNVSTGFPLTMSVSHLDPGIYLLVVQAGKEYGVGRLIISR
jgi:minor extracellular serine protease Vpr